jgi:hypothetical protein
MYAMYRIKWNKIKFLYRALQYKSCHGHTVNQDHFHEKMGWVKRLRPLQVPDDWNTLIYYFKKGSGVWDFMAVL